MLGMLPLLSFTLNDQVSAAANDVTAVINKNTTEKELKDLQVFFEESGIELQLNKVKYNSNNEIVSLNITLKKGKSKSNYSSSSNTPITDIELGYKDGDLYIKSAGVLKIFTSKNGTAFHNRSINVDSIMKNHGLAFKFDQDNDSIFFKGNMNIKKLQDKIMKAFTFIKDEDGTFSFNGNFPSNFHSSGKQKFKFIDSPDIEKLIIIDGKESDFKTLDKLANEDKLAEVDFLKSKTAISIYGDKAKDGAIIATTK